MKIKSLLLSFILGVFALTAISCSSDDDNLSDPSNPGYNEVRKDMSVEVSYSGDFEKGFFVLILSGVISPDGYSSYVAPLIDERDGNAYGPIVLEGEETTQSETLSFHSKDEVAGIMITGSVTAYDTETDIEVNVKVYVEGELRDNRTLTQSTSSSQVNYTVLAEED